jgi:hypothetical protein
LIYFYTRNTFLLSFWSSRQFKFSQCISYIKGNKLGKTAHEINDHFIRSIVEIKSELTTCKINHVSARIESGHLHEMPSLPANLEVICISRYIFQIFFSVNNSDDATRGKDIPLLLKILTEFSPILRYAFSRFGVCFQKWRRSFSPILGQKLPGNPPEKPGWRAKKRSSVGTSSENLGRR